MSNLNKLEGNFSEALELLVEASDLIRGSDELDTTSSLMAVGKAISNIWEVREKIHSLRPDLKPLFAEESRKDKLRYDKLAKLHQWARKAENDGDLQKAQELFLELNEKAKGGYFRLLAEAGLYRVSQAKHCPTK